MALLRALADSETFDVIAVAPQRELFVSLCFPLYPDMIIIDEAAAGDDLDALTEYVAQGRRIVPFVLTTTREPAPYGEKVSTLSVRELHRSGSDARRAVQTALFAAATPIMTSKRTFLADELQAHARQLQELAESGEVRNEVLNLAAWPLDLILIVDDGSNIPRLAASLSEIETIPVPVLVAFEGDLGDGYVELSNVAPKIVRRLREPTSIRNMTGVFVTPKDRHVQLWNENVHVGEGALDFEYLIGSMGWLKSGGLTMVLSSDEPARAKSLGQVASHGGLVAMLDPKYSKRTKAAEAAAEAAPSALMLSPDEVVWLLQYALARKG